MKWKFLVGTLVLSMSISSQSFGFELLDRMLGVSGCCSSGCADAGCAADPSCGCDSGCDTGCAAPACGCASDPSCGCDSGCAAAPTCGCEPVACGCKKSCGGLLGKLFACKKSCNSCAEPTCGCDSGCATAPDCGCASDPSCGCDSGCAAAPACGCGTGAMAPVMMAPTAPEAPVAEPVPADPSASAKRTVRVRQASHVIRFGR